jgi:hypothetical protein
MLDGTASALLGDFLRDSLLVHAAEENSPGDLARVLALQEERLSLAVDETERLKRKKGGNRHSQTVDRDLMSKRIIDSCKCHFMSLASSECPR